MTLSTILRKRALLIIFAYLPTGLGHLRVTDALYRGLPPDISPVLLGSQDQTISAEYRFISIHPFLRKLFVMTQTGILQDIITPIYRGYLRTHTRLLLQQLETILDERLDTPATILMVATHFGLAHQLAELKDKLYEKRKVKALLAVQITDDTPQHIWYIPGADVIFAPSEKVKDSLLEYGKKNKLPKVNFVVNPYPVSPSFSRHLSEHQFNEKHHQLNPHESVKIHLAIPISGAAIGLQFFTDLFDTLHLFSPRYFFHIVVKQTLYTQMFINKMLTKLKYVDLHLGGTDRETVDLYEQLYRHHVISLEVTKPSEQAFKALARPYQTGGSLLLFAEPVGQQEVDNLAFMQRHGLIPSLAMHYKLWHWSEENKTLSSEEKATLHQQAVHWRGLRLPEKANASAQFIHWCLQQEVFAHMLAYQVDPQDTHINEVGSQGVEQFWQIVAGLLG